MTPEEHNRTLNELYGMTRSPGVAAISTGRDPGQSVFVRRGNSSGVNAPTTERNEINALLPKYEKAGKKYLKGYTTSGEAFVRNMGQAETGYRQQLQGLMNQSQRMSGLADQTYQDVSTRQRSIMDKAKSESDSAMTLAEASDPNNRVASSFRDFYEEQAQGTRQAGMADVGVMQALGAQAFGGQMSGMGPVTGGQMVAMAGQNQSQAGMAMANVQRRVQDLRDQGIAEGWRQTDNAYNRGTDARDFYRTSVGDYDTSGRNYQALSGMLRGEMSGYGEDMLGSRSRQNQYSRDYGLDRAGLQHALSTGDLDRSLSAITGEYDRRAADRGVDAQLAAARRTASATERAGMYGALGNIAGPAIGAAIAASDRRLKKNIRPVTNEEAAEFIGALEPVLFQYKDEPDASCEHIGLIAQDIQHTSLGCRIVEDIGGTLMIKKDELVGALLACIKLLG